MRLDRSLAGLLAAYMLWGASAAAAQRSPVSQAPAVAAASSDGEGVYTSAQAARGKTMYMDKCTLCHLDDLSGDQLYNPGPPLAGKVFRARWKARTLLELFELIKTRMPLHTPGTLTAAQVADVVAYMFQVNRFPSGVRELPSDQDALAALRFPERE